MKNFYELLKGRAKSYGDKIFLRIDEKSLTCAEFLKAVDEVKIDCEGEIIFITAKSFYLQAVNFFAAQKFGKVPVILHADLTPDDINFNRADSSAILGALTSGTTGKPKILYRTFESWAGFFDVQNKIFRVDSESKVFIHGSLSFTGNLNTLLATIHAGGTIITSEKFARHNWLELIKTATNIYLVPTKLRFLTDGEPLKNIRGIFTGSQILTATQSINLMKKFPNAEIILYYGASELSFITYKKICADTVNDIQNLGKPFEGVKVEIRDGLIYVDTKFHVNNINVPYAVGDYGHFDAEGNLIFEGRGEDFINRGGVKINAVNVEKKISTIPNIKAVAVVKVKSDIRGEDFKAYIVAPKSVLPVIRKILLPIEMPSEIIFVDELPLNDSGKIIHD